ncbi:hypothetical protein RRG08_050856 [Elysia crispata]|uniref:Plethodontid modulating factor n=1 Tax=Elysia crispata TaxID=231223 RepID=A0AAE0ZDN8_9GAST|nr:hypothetical protein RRG08_050856 [Elysia crispata]
MKTTLTLLLVTSVFIASAAGSACIEDNAGDADGNPCFTDDIYSRSYHGDLTFCCKSGIMSLSTVFVNGVTERTCTCP